MKFRQLPWQLACLLVTMTARAAEIVPSNDSTAISNFGGKLMMQSGDGANLSELVPVSRDAAMIRNNSPLKGNLYDTDALSVQNISNEDMAYISCNPDDYKGNLNAMSVFKEALEQHNLTAVILYSTDTDFCGYNNLTDTLQEFPIFSMTNKDDSKKILNDVRNPNVAEKFFISIASLGSRESDGGGDRPQSQTSLGPSPSTAVAMIILYSITGIITALFLVIIITGAVRAHRHPDRYGPRNVLGRPRQSRARGLGRAILDTIPIVKFGEREPPKPTDVELGSTPEARDVNAANTDTEREGNQPETETRSPEQTTETQQNATTEQPSGIAPAQPLAAGAIVAQENRSADDGLGCSICTDDFEKGQDIRVLPCNHKFHPECVDPWLLNVSGTCPLCRVDLRPTTSRTSNSDDEQDPDMLAPPLQPEAETSYRRRSALRDILSLRSRPNASAEERISALRRLREERNQGSASENTSSEDIAAARRSRRISARLSDVFSSRARRHGNEEANGTTPGSSELLPPPVETGTTSASSSTSNNNTSSNNDTPAQPRS